MMAGQIEEAICFDFQVDSVHSGSISFGRFANEPLLWERRSSFSHNRIQEEVARCSKHKIVTEKKAYFEAQFKKKALLRQCSLDGQQTGRQFDNSEKETPDVTSHKEDYGFVQEPKSGASSETSVYIGYRDDYEYLQEAQVNVHFDESSDVSSVFEQQGMEYHIEGRQILISEHLNVPLSDRVVAKAKVCDAEVTNLDTQTVIDCTYSRCNSAELDVEVERNSDAHTCFVEEECRAIDLCGGSQKAGKEPDAVSHHRDVCPKIMVATEPSGTESNFKITCSQSDSMPEAAKISSKNLTKMGKQSAMETKTLKQAKIIPSIANKLARSTNPEHLLTKSANSIPKTLSGHKSAYKETRVIRHTTSPVTPMMKDAATTHLSPNRTEKVVAPKSSGLKTSPTSFRSRSNVRADQKKEMLPRVAQTGHIQKTGVNRSHGISQDKTLDEIKQVRRGLITKPKPTQSFLSKDERPESKNKDAVANKPQRSPYHPRNRFVGRQSTNIKADSGPPNSPSQGSIITSYPAKTNTKTSGMPSPVNKSTHLSSTRNPVRTKGMTCTEAAKVKNQRVPLKVEAIKGMGTAGLSQSTSERTKKSTIMKVTEKPRLQEICRTSPQVC